MHIRDIEDVFNEMGLGSHEDRQRLNELATGYISGQAFYEESPQEQLFIVLEDNTIQNEETGDGELA